MERTRNCIWNNQGERTQKVWKQELSFLYATHRHDLFYITVGYHDYILKGIQVTERTRKHQRGDNLKSTKARVLIFVRETLSWPVLRNCEVSSKYSKRFSNYRADKKRTDGRQVHRYVPRTFRTRDKKYKTRCLETQHIFHQVAYLSRYPIQNTLSMPDCEIRLLCRYFLHFIYLNTKIFIL